MYHYHEGLQESDYRLHLAHLNHPEPNKRPLSIASENYERLQPKIINYIESFITDFSYEDKMFSHPPE